MFQVGIITSLFCTSKESTGYTMESTDQNKSSDTQSSSTVIPPSDHAEMEPARLPGFMLKDPASFGTGKHRKMKRDAIKLKMKHWNKTGLKGLLEHSDRKRKKVDAKREQQVKETRRVNDEGQYIRFRNHKNLEAEVARLNGLLKDTQSKLQETEGRYRYVDTQLKDAEGKIRRLQEKVQVGPEERIKQLETALARKNADYDSLMQLLRDQRAEINLLEAQLDKK